MTDSWPTDLTAITHARVGLGRVGVGVPTEHLLQFRLDHTLARSAVREPFESAALTAELVDAGLDVVVVDTLTHLRGEFLRRPDLGRRLSDPAIAELRALADARAAEGRPGVDVVIAISDGLSATAVDSHALELVTAIAAALAARGISIGPVVVVPFGRVGVLNDIGAAIGARSAAIVIGERPGLSAPDSLSVYFEVAPRSGLDDSSRNCISNIRPRGLPIEVAAVQVAMLITAGLQRGISGTGLKPEYGEATDMLVAGEPAALSGGSPRLSIRGEDG